MAERALEILDPGLLTTVQDLGRPGFAHLGVPRSGALDAPAIRLANRLVGNPEGAAGLETTATGVRFRLAQAAAVAATGARCEVRVSGRAVAWGAAVAVPPGSLVEIGPALQGLRTYVAVAGGVVVPAVLGSRSTDLLSGLGPAPLAVGSQLPLGTPVAVPTGSEAVPRPAGHEVRLTPGPHPDWFAAETMAGLDGTTYEVGADSNRIGLRLIGPVVNRIRDDELASEPMVLGAVQVPPSGLPVVFLADHPTTGGYPVVGVVREADLPVCAQARPGDRLTLRVR